MRSSMNVQHLMLGIELGVMTHGSWLTGALSTSKTAGWAWELDQHPTAGRFSLDKEVRSQVTTNMCVKVV